MNLFNWVKNLNSSVEKNELPSVSLEVESLEDRQMLATFTEYPNVAESWQMESKQGAWTAYGNVYEGDGDTIESRFKINNSTFQHFTVAGNAWTTGYTPTINNIIRHEYTNKNRLTLEFDLRKYTHYSLDKVELVLDESNHLQEIGGPAFNRVTKVLQTNRIKNEDSLVLKGYQADLRSDSNDYNRPGKTVTTFSSRSIGKGRIKVDITDYVNTMRDRGVEKIGLRIQAGNPFVLEHFGFGDTVNNRSQRLRISGRPHKINKVIFRDLHTEKLQYLSVGEHGYFNGFSTFQGDLKITGPSDAKIESLQLEVREFNRDDNQNRIGDLLLTREFNSKFSKRLKNVFGGDKQVFVNDTQFVKMKSSRLNIPAELGQVEDVVLGVRARFESGAEVYRMYQSPERYGPIRVLVNHESNSRFGSDNRSVGGDGWVQPQVKFSLERFEKWHNIVVGDASKLNGGRLAPHKPNLHNRGAEVEAKWKTSKRLKNGRYLGNFKANKASALRLIDLLNDEVAGLFIHSIHVDFDKSDSSAFWNTIKFEWLNDGRLASWVIKDSPGMTDRFRIQFFEPPE